MPAAFAAAGGCGGSSTTSGHGEAGLDGAGGGSEDASPEATTVTTGVSVPYDGAAMGYAGVFADAGILAYDGGPNGVRPYDGGVLGVIVTGVSVPPGDGSAGAIEDAAADVDAGGPLNPPELPA